MSPIVDDWYITRKEVSKDPWEESWDSVSDGLADDSSILNDMADAIAISSGGIPDPARCRVICVFGELSIEFTAVLN